MQTINKILVTKSKNPIKRKYIMIKMGWFQGIKVGLTLENQHKAYKKK